jgi:hypothetical protein
MSYNIVREAGQRINKKKGQKMKKTLIAMTIVALIALMVPAIAYAGGPPENNGPYIDRYYRVSSHPNPDAQCGTGAGSGAFGFFGPGYNLGIWTDPTDPGANGYQTGLNNSAVCGNR